MGSTTENRTRQKYVLCRAFNPQEAMELMDPKDLTHNIGLRIVQQYAKKMYYNSTFGLNVITIEL